MSGLSLYNIAEELVELKQLREDAEYEGDTEAVKVIDGQIQEWVRGCLAAKADGIRGILKHLAVQVVEWQEEANRFTALAKRAREDADRLKACVLDAMRLLDTKKIEGSKGDVLLRRRGNGGVKPLVIAQLELVPEDMQIVQIKMSLEDWLKWREHLFDTECICEAGNSEPNRGAIRAALERGEGVSGCRLEERGEHLVVE